jgi:AcrR family transcriptional regulator
MPPSAQLGLRERKKLQTRQAIVRATFELVLENGYAGATIAKIAQRADVAPRTIHTTFASKDEILRWHADDHLSRLQYALDHYGGTTMERVVRWVEEEAALGDEKIDPVAELREKAYGSDPYLQGIEYAIRTKAEEMIADAELRANGATGSSIDRLSAEALGAATMRILFGLSRAKRAGEPSSPDELVPALNALAKILAN